jgi:hypothetical protein
LTICTKFVLTKISLTVLNVSYKFCVIMKFAVILYVCVVQFIVSYQDSSDYSHYNRYLEAWLIKSTGSIWKIRLFPLTQFGLCSRTNHSVSTAYQLWYFVDILTYTCWTYLKSSMQTVNCVPHTISSVWSICINRNWIIMLALPLTIGNFKIICGICLQLLWQQLYTG